MHIKKIVVFMVSLLVLVSSTIASAETQNCCQPPKDKIILALQAEGWSKTSTANVSLNIDATLEKKVDIKQIREEILNKLAKVSPGEWQITSFSQTQNESGLEEIHAIAELRMPEKELASLQVQAKAITRPGLSFKVLNIDFSPSLEDRENTRVILREKIYNMITAEINRLQKIYPGQKYAIHTIDFVREISPLNALAKVENAVMVSGAMPMKAEAPVSMMSVSSKILLYAQVELSPIK